MSNTDELREAAQQALDALNRAKGLCGCDAYSPRAEKACKEAIASLRAALAQQPAASGIDGAVLAEVLNDCRVFGELKEPAASGEPVAYMWQHDETSRTGFVDTWQLQNGWRENNPRLHVVVPLYAEPQRAAWWSRW